MLSTMKTRLKYYENVIDNLLHNVELTKELRHQDVKAVIDKYLKEMDLSWVKPEKVMGFDGITEEEYVLLKWKESEILFYSIREIDYVTENLGKIGMISKLAHEVALAMGFAFPNKSSYSSLEDKIAAYYIAKIYLESNADLTECFYDLKI